MIRRVISALHEYFIGTNDPSNAPKRQMLCYLILTLVFTTWASAVFLDLERSYPPVRTLIDVYEIQQHAIAPVRVWLVLSTLLYHAGFRETQCITPHAMSILRSAPPRNTTTATTFSGTFGGSAMLQKSMGSSFPTATTLRSLTQALGTSHKQVEGLK